jgi:hypothetical protein
MDFCFGVAVALQRSSIIVIWSSGGVEIPRMDLRWIFGAVCAGCDRLDTSRKRLAEATKGSVEACRFNQSSVKMSVFRDLLF